MALQAPLGINYVCSSCGTLLYHTGPDGAFEGGEVGFPSRQPYEVAENLASCPKCGHKLNSSPDPEDFKILAKTGAT
jgi:DNA-directed RNA polymerase subunit RPC12/RpoP